MITIKASINVSSNGGTIQGISGTNLIGNNVSANIEDVLGKQSVQVGNPFVLGVSKLGEGAYYADNLPYFMSRQLSDSDGNFQNSYTITINGSNITAFVIAFDTNNGAFPKSITVDGETFVDDDPVWEINCEDTDTHTIVISNWNKNNSPLIITGIYADINIEVDKNNLMSFESDIMDRSNIQYPDYGIISNIARLEVADKNEQILDLINQQILNSGIKITVYIDNNTSNIKEQICEMFIQELSYNNDNRQVNISLKDNLETWQDINVEPLLYDPTNPKTEKAKYFYDYLYGITTDLGYSFEELDTDTLNVLNNTVIEYPLLYSSNLWNEWDKLCQLCFLHIYINNMNKVVVKYNG